MATMLETPSRIWRRIEAIENREVPSLPSIPMYEDSAEVEESAGDLLNSDHELQNSEAEDSMLSRLHSTPTATHHTSTSTSRIPSSASSTARFAHSLASRSSKSSLAGLSTSRGLSMRPTQHDSFEIPSLPRIQSGLVNDRSSESVDEHEKTRSSVPEIYLPPDEDEDEVIGREMSIASAMQSISQISPPSFSPKTRSREQTPKKSYDQSLSIKSESKPSPLDKYRNVALRRGNPRVRTPSLSATSSTGTSSPSHSTPRSNRSAALLDEDSPGSAPPSRSRTTSPAIRLTHPDDDASHSIEPDTSNATHETGAGSMDITDVHVSPPRLDEDGHEYAEAHAESHSEYLNNEHDDDPREPTFSSEGDATPYAYHKKSAKPSNSTFTSPSTSAAFTPTPAFPRPRARFDLASPPDDLLQTPAPKLDENEDENEDDGGDDLMTPHTRRRSFLLSVINSTARPRLKAPTPHPRRFQSASDDTGETPARSSSESPVNNLQSAFAGVTPRPRIPMNRRASHPLAQEITSSSSPSPQEPSRTISHPTWATPAHTSPYDGTVDKASFVSTASSHDLVTHQRANTSFDPAMGFGAGAPGHGVGRFNATKLNNYLHGLNRRLQEENEVLLERLRKVEDDKKGESSTGTTELNKRLSNASRRRSSVGTVLGDVKEDMAEGWLEEKAELEEMVESFKQEAITYMTEKEELEKVLEQEQEERERDKERWKERMAEVEQGVSGIIAELEKKAASAEKRAKAAEDGTSQHLRELQKDLEELRAERDIAMERAEKAERLLESGKDLGSAMTEANHRVAQVMNDLRNANTQIKELEEEAAHADARIEELEKEAEEDKEMLATLEDELNLKSHEVVAEQAKLKQLQDVVRHLEQEARTTKEYADELEEGAAEAIEKIDNLEEELGTAQATIDKLIVAEQQATHDVNTLQEESLKSQESARQMEEALEEAENKMLADEALITDLKTRLVAIERERQREAHNKSDEVSRGVVEASPTEADLQALEAELDDAHKEIARLTTLMNQSPARKAMDKAKEMKIEMLEREKEDLLERNRALRMAYKETTSTPSRILNTSGISPIHRHVLSMSMKVPKTPGGPLPDASWLNSTNLDPSLSPLVAEISRLQRELDIANESIDDKLDRLEDAGLGVVGLTKKLEDARAKISALEDELGRLSKKEARRMRRLARIRCKKCHLKLDVRHLVQADESSIDMTNDNLPDEPPTPPTRTSEALKANLHNINNHLDDLKREWEEEKKRLLGQKASLENQANQLQGQVKSSKEDARKAVEKTRTGEKTKANVESELDKAKRTISVLEAELGSERSRLRSMMTEQERMQREKKQIEMELQRTESDMNEVKEQLQALKKDNRLLEKELRENDNAEQKARIMEKRVTENTETIEHLRQERSLLANNHKDLQKRFSEVSETANKLRKEYSAHSASHDNLRQELDLHRMEIEELRRTLENKTNDLQRIEREKERMASEKSDVAKTVAVLEADLKRVRRDAEAFGRDLKQLRVEKDKLETTGKAELAKAERARKQAQTQIRMLNDELDAQKTKIQLAQQAIQDHVCPADNQQLSKLKLQHNKECKGLIVQIHYLQAKFTREHIFRMDLVHQKGYLLVLLSQFEKSERTIFASIARIGFPVKSALPPPKRRRKTFRSAVQSVIFLTRARRLCEQWNKQTSPKAAVLTALEEVRRKRTQAV